MKAIFVADPISSLDPAVDTTLGLMDAALDCGAEVWTTTARDLEVLDGRPYAHAQAVAERVVMNEPSCIPLDDADAVFMRTNPPLDQTYLNATLVLDLVSPARTAMSNDPRGLRLANEKLYALQFPGSHRHPVFGLAWR